MNLQTGLKNATQSWIFCLLEGTFSIHCRIFRSTHKAAGILLHNTSNYSNNAMFTTSISHRWMNSNAVSDSFLHKNLSKRRRMKMKRHKRPWFYYPNSSAAFNMELIGDLTFKRKPGPSMNRTIPVIVSAQAKHSHALRPTTVLHNATLGSKSCCPRGVNWHNLISIRLFWNFTITL